MLEIVITAYRKAVFTCKGGEYLKSLGIIRKVDELGRVVLPVELRRSLGISVRDSMEIYVDGDRVIFKKHEPQNKCVVTGIIDDDNHVLYDGQLILSEQGAEELLKRLEAINKQ